MAPAHAARSPMQAYAAGQFAWVKGDYASASRLLNNALEGAPSDVVLRQRVFDLALAGGDVSRAIRLARDLSTLDPPTPAVTYTLMADAMDRGDWSGAVKRSARLSQSGVDSLLLPIIRAYAEARRGQTTAALAALAPLDQTPGFRSFRLEHIGHIEAMAGRYDPAREAFDALLGEEPRGFVRQRISAAAVAQRQGDIPAARRFLAGARAVDRLPALDQALARLDAGQLIPLSVTSPKQGVAEAMIRLSTDLVQDQVAPVSIIFSRLASHLGRDIPDLIVDVADLLIRSDQEASALVLLDRVSGNDPVAGRAGLVRASALEALDRKDAARALLETWTSRTPDRLAGWIALGDLERRAERWPPAAAAFGRAISLLDPVTPNDWAIFYARGIAHERGKQWQLAEVDLKQALALRPDDPSVLNYLGYSWLEQGVRLDEATRMIERAVELQPGDGYIIDSLGWAHFLAGRADKALEYLEQAIDAVPGDPTINEHLGDVYWHVGREIEARFRWQAALDLSPEASQQARIERKLAGFEEVARPAARP
jgi:tetratricopeptide (TPR) repeat protein